MKARKGTSSSARKANDDAAPAAATPVADPFLQVLTEVLQRCQAASREPKQDRSRKRNQEILRAAGRVFARDGISRSRIGDIAHEAGMPVSTIYEYYESKEELAYSVPMSTQMGFFAEYIEAVAGKKTAREKLRLYLWLAADYARRHPEWARVLYLEIWPSVLVTESALRQVFDDYVRIILYLLREGEANGEWQPGPDHYETAAILNGSVNQIIITALLYRRPRNLTAAAASIVDRTMALLGPPGRGSRAAASKR